MRRVLLCGLVALVPLPAAWADDDKKSDDKGMVIKGKLSPDDPKDKVLGNSPHKVHEKKMKSGEVYQIDLVSRAFDAFLRLEDSAGKQLAVDDDSGGNLNARLVFQAPKEDTYRIIVTSLNGQAGEYVLTFGPASKAALALSSIQSDMQKHMQVLQKDFVAAPNQEKKDQVLAKYFDLVAANIEKYTKVAADFPGSKEARQATMMAGQNLQMLGNANSPAVAKIVRKLATKSSDQGIRTQANVVLGRILRTQYEAAYEKKDPKAPELYREAEKNLMDLAKSAASGLKQQVEDALFELQKLSVGKTAPEIEGEDLDGKKFKLSDYRGKVVVLDFWGNW